MTTRLVSVASGRPCVTERWGTTLGETAVLFQLAIWSVNGRTNPLDAMDDLAERWRALDVELARELPEVAP
jgi:hypothetical protein